MSRSSRPRLSVGPIISDGFDDDDDDDVVVDAAAAGSFENIGLPTTVARLTRFDVLLSSLSDGVTKPPLSSKLDSDDFVFMRLKEPGGKDTDKDADEDKDKLTVCQYFLWTICHRNCA